MHCIRCNAPMMELPSGRFVCSAVGCITPETQDTQGVAPKGGPYRSPQPPVETRVDLHGEASRHILHMVENHWRERLQIAIKAFWLWYNDVGGILSARVANPGDATTPTDALQECFLDAWLLGNLADRPDYAKPQSGVKPVIPEKG